MKSLLSETLLIGIYIILLSNNLRSLIVIFKTKVLNYDSKKKVKKIKRNFSKILKIIVNIPYL